MIPAMRLLCAMILMAAALHGGETPLEFDVRLDVIRDDGFDGKTSWFHPRPAIIPGETPTVVVTLQKMLVANTATSDVFLPVNSQFSTDLGKTWTKPALHKNLGRRRDADGADTAVCDMTPKWHARTGKLLATGHTARYRGDRLIKRHEQGMMIPDYPRITVWSVYDPAANDWSPWAAMTLTADENFWDASGGCAQRVDLENGEILLPLSHKAKTGPINYGLTVARCRFDGKELAYVEHGNELTLEHGRGLLEPSLARYRGRFYMTIRNEEAGYVMVSTDGMKYDAPRKWTFDDGKDLGSYNTQAHWVTHSDGLFLVYTRRGADNDNVFRHRAPLFMAQVDPERLVVLRATERALIPNKGADLGNFGAINVGPHETWVTAAEGMRPNSKAIELGANDRVYAARITWKKPNAEWDK